MTSSGADAKLAGDIAVFVVREFQGFFEHLADALSASAEGKPLPAAVFIHGRTKKERARGGRAQKHGRADKPKRKPTMFNLFIKHKIEELKPTEPSSSTSGTGLFKQAIEEWKSLSASAKKAWSDEHREELAAISATAEDLPNIPEPTPAPEPAPVEREQEDAGQPEQGKKKKKKRHHEEEARPTGPDGEKKKKKKKKQGDADQST